ncbi:MAG TPA: hypothetical protein VD833_14815 [Vicinamibacterales bacterium]|nr:hypothetical protein [Vicinamibacterales bacterium]
MANGTPATSLTVMPTAADLEGEVRNLYDARDYLQAAEIKVRDARRRVDADLARWAIDALRPGPRGEVGLAADAIVKRMKEAEAELARITEQERALQAMVKRVTDRLEQLKKESPDVVARELERRRAELQKRRENEESDVAQVETRLAALERELKALRPAAARASRQSQAAPKRARKTSARKRPTP